MWLDDSDWPYIIAKLNGLHLNEWIEMNRQNYKTLFSKILFIIYLKKSKKKNLMQNTYFHITTL